MCPLFLPTQFLIRQRSLPLMPASKLNFLTNYSCGTVLIPFWPSEHTSTHCSHFFKASDHLGIQYLEYWHYKTFFLRTHVASHLGSFFFASNHPFVFCSFSFASNSLFYFLIIFSSKCQGYWSLVWFIFYLLCRKWVWKFGKLFLPARETIMYGICGIQHSQCEAWQAPHGLFWWLNLPVQGMAFMLYGPYDNAVGVFLITPSGWSYLAMCTWSHIITSSLQHKLCLHLQCFFIIPWWCLFPRSTLHMMSNPSHYLRFCKCVYNVSFAVWLWK